MYAIQNVHVVRVGHTLSKHKNSHLSGQYLPYLTFSYFLGFNFPSVNTTYWPFPTPGLQFGASSSYPNTELSSPLLPSPKIAPISSTNPNPIWCHGPRVPWGHFWPHLHLWIPFHFYIHFVLLSLGTLSRVCHICLRVPGNREKIELYFYVKDSISYSNCVPSGQEGQGWTRNRLTGQWNSWRAFSLLVLCSFKSLQQGSKGPAQYPLRNSKMSMNLQPRNWWPIL